MKNEIGLIFTLGNIVPGVLVSHAVFHTAPSSNSSRELIQKFALSILYDAGIPLPSWAP